MSLVITGNPSNITTPLSATVTAMANNGSGAIRVTTLTPHLFGTADVINMQVTISSTFFNFTHPCTIIDATHFDLVGSTFIGTGAGTAYDLSLTPQIQVPTDGDSFSLQLSGMLSALQGLADRTQFLRNMFASGVATLVPVSVSGNVPVPVGATHVLIDGCGGGGGGGGGQGGYTGIDHIQAPAGGGGAGSRRVQALFSVFQASSFDVVIGAGGGGGAGSNGNPAPTPGIHGSDGLSTTVTYHNGIFPGTTFATLLGGAGGGGGGAPVATNTGTPAFTPGGRGAAGLFRSGPSGLYPQPAPGFRQVYGLVNTSGTITGPASGWEPGVYTDPVGQMDYYEGGASVANAANATYAAAVSYAGAPGFAGEFSGGPAGSNGSHSGGYVGGAGGGGGGGGSFGAGGDGGNGGNGTSGTATNGVAGNTLTTPSGGAGGGGGGGGGSGGSAAGNGAAGGNGGNGFLNLVFFAFN